MNLRGFGEALKSVLQGRPVEADGHPSEREAGRLLSEYVKQTANAPTWREVKPKGVEAGQAILAADEATQIAVVHAALQRMVRIGGGWERKRMPQWQALRGLTNHVLAQHLPLSQADLIQMLEQVLAFAGRMRVAPANFAYSFASLFPLRRIVQQVERYAARHGVPAELELLLRQLRPEGREDLWTGDQREIAQRIDGLLGRTPEEQASFAPGEPWACAARAELEAMDSETQSAWRALLAHASHSEGSSPSQRWLNQAKAMLDGVGEASFKKRVRHWFAAASEPADAPMHDQNCASLKGLAWISTLLSDVTLCRVLGCLGEACYKKIPGYGPRSERVGNACVYALGVIRDPEAVAQLARLRIRVRYQAGQEAVRKALEAAAEPTGMAPVELEELSVPTFGIDAKGQWTEPYGRFTAEVTIVGPHDVALQWRAEDSRLQKSVPAEIRRDHPEELKALKQTVHEIERMLAAQRDRIEAFLRTERSWSLSIWRERYLDHPILSVLTRRLVWHFQHSDRTALAIWREGRLVSTTDQLLGWPAEDTQVRLWHPIGFPPETILRWRCWLEEHSVTQPFKQAHREVYALTDAELDTCSYSNRFAAHLLKQHQFKALCDQRGWRYRLQGGFNSSDEPCASLFLPEWGLTAGFWVDPIWQEEDGFAGSGVSPYVSTDQVRFCDAYGQARPLTEVPALVFTEVMRDVDLFVGVASVGNDPNWQDSGGAVGYQDYWQRYAFGDLSASANTRREVLERLLPKLKIASRCSLAGRFLVVKGELRTYKIHLGSSNILMEPNDQYLCIVPDRGVGARGDGGALFLPFEGDRTLSLILSKAFLLAEDTRIKDPTIVSQIGRR